MFTERIQPQDLRIINPYPGFQSYIDAMNMVDGLDLSITAELTVLLQPRIPEEAPRPWMDILSAELNERDFEDFHTFIEGTPENALRFYKVRALPEKEYPEGFEHLRDIETFLSDRRINAHIVINESRRQSFVLVEGLNIISFHTMGVFVSRLLPWFFKDNPLTEEETSFVKTMIASDGEEFKRMCNELTEQRFDLRSAMIHMALDGYRERYINTMRDSLKGEINYLEEQIESHYNRIRENRRAIMEKSIRFNGLSVVGEDVEDLTQFLIDTESIDVKSVSNDGELRIGVATTLSNFDRDDAENVVTNSDAYIYARTGSYSTEDAMALLKEIFVEETYVIKMYAEFALNLIQRYAQSIRGFNPKGGYMPNKHMQLHACLGNNGEMIRQAFDAGNDIGVINAIIASVANINVSEVASNEAFFSELFVTTDKVIIAPDGEEITVAEAIRRIKEENE